MSENLTALACLPPTVCVRETDARGRGLFAGAAIAKDQLVLEVLPYCSAIAPVHRQRTCPVCFAYSGFRGPKHPFSSYCCSSICEDMWKKLPGTSIAQDWLDTLNNTIRIRKLKKSKHKTQKDASIDASKTSHVSEGSAPYLVKDIWESRNIDTSQFVPDAIEVDTCALVISALSRKWTEEHADAAISEAAPIASTDQGDAISSASMAAHQQPIAPDFNMLLLMQDSEHVFYAHAGVDPATPLILAEQPRLESFVLCYQLLRMLQETKDPTRPPLLPIMGPDSSLFRAVVFREMANSFGIWEPGPNSPDQPGYSGRELLGLAMFPQATFFNHSCAPSVRRRDTYGEGGRTAFVALRDIAAGDELTIGYCDLSDRRTARRDYLVHAYMFECACSRCTTEEE